MAASAGPAYEGKHPEADPGRDRAAPRRCGAAPGIARLSLRAPTIVQARWIGLEETRTFQVEAVKDGPAPVIVAGLLSERQGENLAGLWKDQVRPIGVRDGRLVEADGGGRNGLAVEHPK